MTNGSDLLDKAQEIILALEAKGITRYNIAQETGLPEATLSRWVKKKVKKADPDKFARLEKFYQSRI